MQTFIVLNPSKIYRHSYMLSYVDILSRYHIGGHIDFQEVLRFVYIQTSVSSYGLHENIRYSHFLQNQKSTVNKKI